MAAVPTWRTATGKKIPVAELTDKHLLNAIRLILRRCDAQLDAVESAAAAFDPDSMAAYYADHELSNAMIEVQYPILGYLRAEAKKRGLREHPRE